MVPRLTRIILSLIISFVLASWIPALAQQIQARLYAPIDGVYTNTVDFNRPDTYAKVLDNLHQNKQGVWSSYYGGCTTGSAAGTTGFGQIYELSKHTNSTGNRRFIALEGTKAWASIVPWFFSKTQIGNTLSYTGPTPCVRSYTGSVCLLTNQNFEPKAWDGDYTTPTTFTALAGWPITVGGISYSKPAYCEPFINRVAYAGFAAKPYSVVLSKAGTHNTFTTTSPTAATDAGAFEFPSYLGIIKGMKTIRLGNDSNAQVLLIGFERGFAIIGGNDATDFYSRVITTQYGLLNDRGWFLAGNTLFFPATDGIRSLSNVNSLATLVPSDTLAVNDLWTRIPPSYSGGGWHDPPEDVFCVDLPSRGEAYYWIPTSVSTYCANKALVIGYKRQSSDGSTKPILSTVSTVAATCGVTALKDPSIYSAAVINYDIFCTGQIGGDILFFPATSWNPTNNTLIPWIYISPLIRTDDSDPSRSSTSQRFLILTDGGDQKFKAIVYALTTDQNGNSVWRSVFTKRVDLTSSSTTDLSTWGSGTTTSYPHIIELDPPGNAKFWQIKLYAENAGDSIDLIGIVHKQIVGGTRQ